MTGTGPRDALRRGPVVLSLASAFGHPVLSSVRSCILASILASMLAPSLAAAHLGHAVQSAERYLKVDFARGHARVVVSLMLGPGEASRVLHLADREDGDGDGTLTSAEADAYLARWAVGLSEDLTIEVDGVPVDVAWGEAYLDPPGPIGPRPATVEMIARIPLVEGEHHLVLRDAMRRETFERTDVAFSSRDGAELVASGAGEERPSARVPAIAFADVRGPDAFSAVAIVQGVRDAEDSAPGTAVGGRPGESLGNSWVLGAGIIALVALGLGGLLLLRRRS